MALIVYMSHPIGDGSTADLERRQDNIATAGEWIRFFVDTTRWVIVCPWYVYAITHGEEIHAPRRLVDQLAALERCDLLVLVGGIITAHMQLEINAAKRRGIPVVDLTTFGVGPPSISEDLTQVLLARAKSSMMRTPRRVWMPMLTPADIQVLVGARHQLDVALPGEQDAAIALIDRIIIAATDYGT